MDKTIEERINSLEHRTGNNFKAIHLLIHQVKKLNKELADFKELFDEIRRGN